MSFSVAGERLFITPSAVSHQIKSLEQELEQSLFKRSARELALTADGQALFDALNPLIEQIDEVVAAAKGRTTGKRIKLSVQPFFASEYFLPRLAEFTTANPELDIEVGASDETAETKRHNADLSIRLHREPPAGLESQALMPLTLVVAGSKKFAKSLEVDDQRITSRFPIIVHESLPNVWKQWSKGAGIKLPKSPKVTRLDSMIAIVRAAEQGIGAALVPVPIANQWFQQKTIVQLFEQPVDAGLSYYLSWHQVAAARPEVALLRDWTLERFTT